MINQPKTNSHACEIHPFFSTVAISGSSSAVPLSGRPHTEVPVSIDLMDTASPVAPLSDFLSAESLSTLHAEFASIPDLVAGATPILEESILDLVNENDTEDNESDDFSSGDNISGSTTSTENPSDSEGDSGNISGQFLKTVLANLKAEIETNHKPEIYSDGRN
jgi:hypothetical protein